MKLPVAPPPFAGLVTRRPGQVGKVLAAGIGARTDLLGLVANRLLQQERRGKALFFRARPDLGDRLTR